MRRVDGPPPPAEFDIARSDPADGVVNLELSGELDLHTGFRLDRVLRAVEDEGPQVIVVDLRELDLLDSTGLAKLVAAHRRAADGGWRLAIVRGGRLVETVLKATRLDGYLDVVSDPVEALPASSG